MWQEIRPIDTDLGVANEEPTATMNPRRRLVQQKYAALIESMYSG